MTCAAVLIAPAPAFAQYAPMGETDAVVRVEQLENRLRQLTGENEQLQFRVRQLEEQLRQQGGAAAPAGRTNTATAPPQRQVGTPQDAAPPPPYQQQPTYPPPPYQQSAPQQVAVPPGYPQQAGRRGDAFDPNANPNAPGVPRPLGSIVGQPSAPERADVGAPGGRAAGEPLDLGQMSPQQSAGPTLATTAPTQTPRDEYDLGYGYIQRKDYALAEETLRGFVRKYPNDRLVADAQYWLGESLFQRQRYRDAAESFLTVTTKYDTATRAPDALLRLGQSLAALKEKEAACAAFGEVTRKYPRASGGVKQGVDREQKRNGC
ncbi:tol-pal system protein YbgF [Bradyrhizobium sp. LHD-71]|uniref:tol-pal system protein YbgF n=1 Tax=Bradyrhizobium sp. LHD-71 TaxID=3072141 RepID=UPI0028107C94|nr:tol-pal system protein YbgF [Bradyrhizobium sp. LHD-71]MDQ8729003.1 tol-pal system protein YbgF [Bradyrhizobium sp. LHD-71]